MQREEEEDLEDEIADGSRCATRGSQRKLGSLTGTLRDEVTFEDLRVVVRRKDGSRKDN